MGNGIAIPHARVAGVKSPFGMLARLKQPVEFEAVDGQPVDLVFLLLVPASSQGEQLNVLACVSRRLRDREVLEALRGAKDSRALYRRMTEDAKRF
jgi:PTS system nitrogen regulatory IIA component